MAIWTGLALEGLAYEERLVFSWDHRAVFQQAALPPLLAESVEAEVQYK